MPAVHVDRTKGPPLWAQVRADLRNRLAAGEFQEHFPGEHALMAEYGVSRNTVREALRPLREEGLVTAERGRAPRRCTPVVEEPQGALYSLFHALEGPGMSRGSRVRTLDVRADGVIAQRLGLDGSTPLLFLDRIRFVGEDVVALDRVWLPAALAAPLLDVDFERNLLYPELFRRTGLRIGGGRERIEAIRPSRAEAEALRCPARVAVYSVERTGYADDRPVEWRQMLIRGDRFAFRAQFSAGDGYRVDLVTEQQQSVPSMVDRATDRP